MKRILLPAFLGGVTVFIWGAISWMVLPWHNMTMHNLPGENAVIETLQGQISKSGVYVFPGMPKDDTNGDATQAEWEAKHRRGPLGVLVYITQGYDPMAVGPFLRGFVLNLIAATIIAYLLAVAVGALPGFGQRVLFVALIGVFAGVVSHFTYWNWLYFPTDYTLSLFADVVIGWVLAGLVMAWRIKPTAATAAAA